MQFDLHSDTQFLQYKGILLPHFIQYNTGRITKVLQMRRKHTSKCKKTIKITIIKEYNAKTS